MQISVDKEAMTNLACMCVAVVSMWTNPACMCVDVVSMWITHKTLLMTGTFLKTPFVLFGFFFSYRHRAHPHQKWIF